MEDILTRMGDGQRITMSASQVKEELLVGTKNAADTGRVPPLTSSELKQLFEIIADRNRVVTVERGEEIVLTDDLSCVRHIGDEGAAGGVGIPMSRLQAILVHERSYAQDSAVFQVPYGSGGNIQRVKEKITIDMQAHETVSLLATIPMFYTFAPSVLWYYRPSGPYKNPADLLPQGKIRETREAAEKAAERLTEDVVYIGKKMYSIGCDAINLDTCASGGDAEFYSNLNIVSKLKQEAPHMAIEMGMSNEFIIGVHGEMTFDGQRLAGMFPHQQVKVAETAGVDIFGPVINTNSSKSFPWNLARAVTFVKLTVDESNIPIHVNAGMGVCSVPMQPTPPIDCVSRMAKAMVHVARIDGLQVGVGDPFGMPITHGVAAGMGGIRTAGDLVMWMQMTRRMRLPEAKKYVAEKLKVAPEDLVDECEMRFVREDLGIGTITAIPGVPRGIAAKRRIGELLGIEINSVNKMWHKS